MINKETEKKMVNLLCEELYFIIQDPETDGDRIIAQALAILEYRLMINLGRVENFRREAGAKLRKSDNNAK